VLRVVAVLEAELAVVEEVTSFAPRIPLLDRAWPTVFFM